MPDPNEPERLNTTGFFFPFGTYNTDKKASRRASEILIGRDNERASFIRRLLNSGKGGAYLVTGYRGAGKTSFVDHCLEAYEQDSVGRFMRSGLGKRPLDIALGAIVLFVLLCFPLVAVQLLTESSLSLAFAAVIALILMLWLLVLYWAGLMCLKPVYENALVCHVLMSIAYLGCLFCSWAGFGVVLGLVFPFVLALQLVLILGCFSGFGVSELPEKVRLLSIFKWLTSFAYGSILIYLSFMGRDSGLQSLQVCLIVVFIVLIVLFVFWLEWHWVVKPAQRITNRKPTLVDSENVPDAIKNCLKKDGCERDNKPDGPNAKKAAKLENCYRDLYQTCWLRAICQFWKPLITIRMNLGFDDTSHGNVLYVLLKQIKTKYHEQFLCLTNPRVWLTKTTGLIATFWLAVLIGDSVFAFQVPNDFRPSGEPATVESDKPNQANKWQWLDSGNVNLLELGPVGPAIVPSLFGFQLHLSRGSEDEKSFYLLEVIDAHWKVYETTGVIQKRWW